MVTKINLTKRTIKALEVPSQGGVYHRDLTTPNLQLCVTSAGTKTYYRVGRINGQNVRLRIGTVEEYTPSQARAECLSLSALIARGIDPRDDKTDANKVTLGQLFGWYLEHHAKPHNRCWQRDERRFNRVLKKWSNKKLTSITTESLTRLHHKVTAESGPYAGNHLIELVTKLYNKAIDIGWATTNPCRGVKLNKEVSRERFLLPEEVPRFFTAVSNLVREGTRDFFLMLLYTGARRDNVCSMRWDDIQFEVGVWTIPAENAKGGEVMRLPLSEFALEILERRFKDSESEWVFPGGGKTGHLVEPKAAWDKVRKEAKLGDMRMHDLRRTLGSWQAAQNTSLQIIGKSLGHSDLRATAIYARLQLDPVRESVSAATAAMLKIAKENQK
jgi:integrase